MPGGRPAKPMFPAPPATECADGALPLAEACKFLGIGRSSLYELIAKGELEVVKYGRKPRVLKRQLQEHLTRELEAARAERGAGLRIA